MRICDWSCGVFSSGLSTAPVLGEAMGREILVTFQSRFGRAKWLEPATDASLVALAKEGVRHIAVTTPGFAADCLETLEEIALRGKESFLRHGGEKFAFLPCLNAEDEAILMYGRLMGRELSGWWSRRSEEHTSELQSLMRHP